MADGRALGLLKLWPEETKQVREKSEGERQRSGTSLGVAAPFSPKAEFPARKGCAEFSYYATTSQCVEASEELEDRRDLPNTSTKRNNTIDTARSATQPAQSRYLALLVSSAARTSSSKTRLISPPSSAPRKNLTFAPPSPAP